MLARLLLKKSRLLRIASPIQQYTTFTSTPNFTTLKRKMSQGQAHEGSTLKQKIPKQSQDLPGLQKEMEPEPFNTKLETANGPKPYTGVGKLRGKKTLITGGE